MRYYIPPPPPNTISCPTCFGICRIGGRVAIIPCEDGGHELDIKPGEPCPACCGSGRVYITPAKRFIEQPTESI